MGHIYLSLLSTSQAQVNHGKCQVPPHERRNSTKHQLPTSFLSVLPDGPSSSNSLYSSNLVEVL